MASIRYMCSLIHLSHSRQATLYIAFRHITGLTQAVKSKEFHPHEPSTEAGSRLHAFADRPSTLTPSISTQLGVKCKHKRLHRCALWRIFRPAFENMCTD